MDNKYKLIADSFGKEKFKFDEMLKNYMAMDVGGPAKLFFIAFKTSEIIKLISMARQINIAVLFFGTGSKLAISDQGFDGLVIKNRTTNIEIVSLKGKATRVGIGVEEALVEVEGGVSINKFVEFLESHNLSSEEFVNISGSIGGNLFVNRFLQMYCKSIKVLDLNDSIDEIEVSQLSLKKHIILSAVFKIKSK